MKKQKQILDKEIHFRLLASDLDRITSIAAANHLPPTTLCRMILLKGLNNYSLYADQVALTC